MTDGWFERNMFSELAVLLPIVAMIVFGTLYATTYPVLATISIAVAMQQAGWLGHDMTHAKDSYYCDTMLGFTSGFINGFNREWWSAKHNTHHVMTNHVGVDPDIDLMPASAYFHNCCARVGSADALPLATLLRVPEITDERAIVSP
jgi:fatty acid desaturase